MIVDSSALVAIIHDESGCEELYRKIVYSEAVPRMSSGNYLETSIVVDRKGDPASSRKLDDLIADLEIEIVPFTAEQARLAREAYRDYGKGSGHPARLNFGDSIAYALAKAERRPLLFVGSDFTHTDVESA